MALQHLKKAEMESGVHEFLAWLKKTLEFHGTQVGGSIIWNELKEAEGHTRGFRGIQKMMNEVDEFLELPDVKSYAEDCGLGSVL